MSSILVHIPDDGWIESGSPMEPDDNMLCIVIHRYGNRTPGIYQFRKTKNSGYFLDVSEKWRMESLGCEEEWEPSFATFGTIDYWKPLGLPKEENQRILKEIESWFEE